MYKPFYKFCNHLQKPYNRLQELYNHLWNFYKHFCYDMDAYNHEAKLFQYRIEKTREVWEKLLGIVSF
ncbi:MAG: hypothetical protein LBC46_06200 [Treponema sp.]|nr:hypothetical protein [Treponema sp.]